MHVPLPRSPRVGLVLALGITLGGCGSEDPVAPIDTTLIGVWNLVGFTDGERVAVPSGTWVFFDDGLMAMDLTFNFPNEGTSFLAATGTFERAGEIVDFTIRGGDSQWRLEFTTDDVLLTQTSPAPADNTIRLGRI